MITHRYGNMQTPPASSEGKSLAGRWQSWARKEQGTATAASTSPATPLDAARGGVWQLPKLPLT